MSVAKKRPPEMEVWCDSGGLAVRLTIYLMLKNTHCDGICQVANAIHCSGLGDISGINL